MLEEDRIAQPWWRAPITVAAAAFIGLVILGLIFTALNVKADREHGLPPESSIGFGAEFTWWLAGAVACFGYVLVGSYLLRLRSGSRNPLVRASCLVAVPLLGLVCPVAVQWAIDRTREGYPGFICILPSLFLVWLPWLFAVGGIALITIGRRTLREPAPSN
jgi:hypothetical protein